MPRPERLRPPGRRLHLVPSPGQLPAAFRLHQGHRWGATAQDAVLQRGPRLQPPVLFVLQARRRARMVGIMLLPTCIENIYTAG